MIGVGLFFELYEVCFQEFLRGADGFFPDGAWALGDPYCKVIKLLRIDFEPLAVPV